jgi:IS5 family transposase
MIKAIFNAHRFNEKLLRGGAGKFAALPAIGVIKRVFGFAKVRYRGLKKNTHRLLVTCALANLFMVRRHLLRCQGA